ncbi:ATP-dependent DNA helicase OS=Streptomyces tendae OX=1932 GN=pcrA PE=3 SV=1 [Streptomyces tendae]
MTRTCSASSPTSPSTTAAASGTSWSSEYQDTNHAQYALVRELVGGASEHPVDVPPEAEVPPAEVVRGGRRRPARSMPSAARRIRNILQFEEDYPDATTILLEQNYRSTQTILSAANAVIERNESRRPKNLWT